MECNSADNSDFSDSNTSSFFLSFEVSFEGLEAGTFEGEAFDLVVRTGADPLVSPCCALVCLPRASDRENVFKQCGH